MLCVAYNILCLQSIEVHLVQQPVLHFLQQVPGGWGYHPVVVSLANPQEPLHQVNRSGNRLSSEGAAARFDQEAQLRALQSRAIVLTRSKLQDGRDVVGLQKRVVLENFITTCAGRKPDRARLSRGWGVNQPDVCLVDQCRSLQAVADALASHAAAHDKTELRFNRWNGRVRVHRTELSRRHRWQGAGLPACGNFRPEPSPGAS